MKKVEAYIRHEAFEPIRMELLSLGFPSLSISEVKGSGRQKGITERYRGAELTNYLRPKVKLECVVADRDVQTIVDTILKHARTGAVGDGKVFVMPVEEAYRVRTGEAGEEILQAHPDARARGLRCSSDRGLGCRGADPDESGGAGVKKVEAFIRHEAFEPIRMELLSLGFPSLSISEVKGSGRQKGITERYRGAELTNYLRPKVKLECVVADRDVQTIVDTVLKHARTGAVGDGKVFVLPVEESYRVRTGESGEEVLQAHPDAAAATTS